MPRAAASLDILLQTPGGPGTLVAVFDCGLGVGPDLACVPRIPERTRRTPGPS